MGLLPAWHGKDTTATMSTTHLPFSAIGECWVTNPKQKLIFPGRIFTPYNRFQDLFYRAHGRSQFPEPGIASRYLHFAMRQLKRSALLELTGTTILLH